MHDTLTDAELVAGHLAGDRSALAAIYDRYADSLHDTAAAMTRQRHDAADVLQDVFVAAAERMGQLRDPAKLKPWLFAILRNEVYRRTGKQRRTVATDFTDPVAEMSVPTQPADDGTNVEYEELAGLVRAAAAGLDERDQLVLELSVRQGLQGDDLAAALGVSAQQCYGLVHRMRQRTERSLAAYCVARTGRKECTELAEILRGWDGEFSVLIRKRVARHVDGCDTCERSRRTLAPFALFGAAPVFAAPAELRDRVLAAAGGSPPPPAYGFEAPGGFPSAIRSARRIGLWFLGTAALVFVGLGAAVVVLADDDASVAIDDGTTTSVAEATTTSAGDTSTLPVAPVTEPPATTATSVAPSTSATPASTTTTVVASAPASTVIGTTIPTTPTTAPPTTPATTAPPTTAPPTSAPPTTAPPTTAPSAPGSLAVSAGSIHFDTTVDSRAVTLTNTGGRAVDWSATAGPLGFANAMSPFTFSPSSGTLQPGAAVQVVFEIDRDWPTEGSVPGRRVTFSGAGTSAAIDLTGEVGRAPVVRPVAVPPASGCVWFLANGVSWQVAIDDETPPISAVVELVTPSGVVQVDELIEDDDWFGLVSGDGDQDGVVDAGTHTWTIRATDALGNVGTLSGTMELSLDTIDC
jgi:RNA polymerase sigma factor (sigma-70 family)